ncbi:hypothetical protein QBC40DRAFT_350599 [Triangularia verruculosa]|uniref:ANK_REP_REGION domain-containing protein n=1 Tax=Triangularia verruculosa TaxID=2587418 RepID=A0AAN6XCP7_9PEZI|nr:hypothetical protein QBC40DRAFT_350599 [Triangularia verruculosa]
MAAIETRIQQFSIQSTNRHRVQFWKRFKALLCEKELQLMRQTVQGHVALLTLHLNVIQMRYKPASESQASQIYEMLIKLEGNVDGLKERFNSDATIDKTLEEPANYADKPGERLVEPEAFEPGSKLVESISRLLDVVSQTRGTVQSENAAQLIEDLQLLVQTAQKHSTQPPGIRRVAATAVATVDSCYSEQEKVQDIRRELQLVSGLILSSPSVDINRRASKRHQPVSGGSLLQHVRKQKSINLADGVMTISIKCQRRRRRNTVPKAHKAFSLAFQGSTKDLVSLFNSGKASLYDQDENEWTLLHYACLGNQTALCRFLTESGLEVDEVSNNERQYNHTPLHLALWRYKMDQRAMATIKTLLEFGADPSLESKATSDLIQRFKCFSGMQAVQLGVNSLLTLHLMPQDLRHDRTFLEPIMKCASDFLLLLCGIISIDTYEHLSIQPFHRLLRQKNDICERARFGLTCLHLLLSNLVDSSRTGPSFHFLGDLVRSNFEVDLADSSFMDSFWFGEPESPVFQPFLIFIQSALVFLISNGVDV